jgi:hypothetical protein
MKISNLKSQISNLSLAVCLAAAPALMPISAFFAIGAGVLSLTSGCASNQTVYRTSGTAKVTADAAMRTWGAYVAQFNPSVEKEQQVKAAFEKYQAAQLLLLDSAIAYRKAEASGGDKTAAQAKLDASIAGASAALGDLIGLIESFGVKLQ